MRENPATTSCLVDRLTAYALGRSATAGQIVFLDYLKATFVKDGYRLPDLMRRIATSEALYAVSAPEEDAKPVQSAAAAVATGAALQEVSP